MSHDLNSETFLLFVFIFEQYLLDILIRYLTNILVRRCYGVYNEETNSCGGIGVAAKLRSRVNCDLQYCIKKDATLSSVH